jgi:hypothetical protein
MSTLADLRRQNIAEQKGEGEPLPADAEVRTSALPQPSTEEETSEPSAFTEIRKSVSTQASKEPRKRVSKQLPTHALTEVTADSLTARVKEALELKRNHQGGVKATVEMSPELSKRAKTYCLEHDFSSVRVLCLELLEAFLAEEGF